MEREFDRVLKIAMPYLIFSPNGIRDTVADYMKSLWFAMRNNNQIDFDLHCKNINEAIANSEGCTDSHLQCNISDFDERWSGLDESIAKIKKELIDLRKDVNSIKKKKKPEIKTETPDAIDVIKEVKEEFKEVKPEIKPVMGKIELPKKRWTQDETEQELEKIRNYLKTNREITNPTVREICGVNVDKAKNLLQKLVKENFVERKGKSRFAKYILKG